MGANYYILDAKTQDAVAVSRAEYQADVTRRGTDMPPSLAHDEVGDIHVSTVLLPFDHDTAWTREHPDQPSPHQLVWETAILVREHMVTGQRHRSRAEALACHAECIRKAREWFDVGRHGNKE